MGRNILLIINTILFLSSAGSFIEPARASAEDSFQKGVCYASWEKEHYSSAYSDSSLKKISGIGAEWVGIVTTYYQDRYNSKDIYPTDKTPSDKSLMHAVNTAHSLGIKVMLKPHIDLLNQADGLWRGDIGFQSETDWREWFSQYLEFILHYAKLAQEAEVELFCIGTELSFASTKTAFWRQEIIPRIRQIYSGKIIYAANWDEYQNIGFWDMLDYAGIDAYFPLTPKKDPTYEDIKSGWEKWAQEIRAWQASVNKPVIFTEIGYRSCSFAATAPWEYTFNPELNLEIQADCYKAALEVLRGQNWCVGLYWWYWKDSPFAGGAANRDFTPQNKPAETVLAYYYRNPALF